LDDAGIQFEGVAELVARQSIGEDGEPAHRRPESVEAAETVVEAIEPVVEPIPEVHVGKRAQVPGEGIEGIDREIIIEPIEAEPVEVIKAVIEIVEPIESVELVEILEIPEVRPSRRELPEPYLTAAPETNRDLPSPAEKTEKTGLGPSLDQTRRKEEKTKEQLNPTHCSATTFAHNNLH
jgi:hypothetical protein